MFDSLQNSHWCSRGWLKRNRHLTSSTAIFIMALVVEIPLCLFLSFFGIKDFAVCLSASDSVAKITQKMRRVSTLSIGAKQSFYHHSLSTGVIPSMHSIHKWQRSYLQLFLGMYSEVVSHSCTTAMSKKSSVYANLPPMKQKLTL